MPESTPESGLLPRPEHETEQKKEQFEIPTPSARVEAEFSVPEGTEFQIDGKPFPSEGERGEMKDFIVSGVKISQEKLNEKITKAKSTAQIIESQNDLSDLP